MGAEDPHKGKEALALLFISTVYSLFQDLRASYWLKQV